MIRHHGNYNCPHFFFYISHQCLNPGWSCCGNESDSAPWLDSVLGKSKEGVVGAQVPWSSSHFCYVFNLFIYSGHPQYFVDREVGRSFDPVLVWKSTAGDSKEGLFFFHTWCAAGAIH